MRFTPGSVSGQWIIDLTPVEDHRGYFARAWCATEFAQHGLTAEWPQQNMQHSPNAGTMRGFHYQIPPHAEVKLVRCTRGSVYDVTIDLRPQSPTFGEWSGVELRASSHRAVWVPQGCAHGYATLEDDTEVFYLTSRQYVAASVRSIRFDDPRFEITWPRPIESVPPGCDSWPDFKDEQAAELAEVPLPSASA